MAGLQVCKFRVCDIAAGEWYDRGVMVEKVVLDSNVFMAAAFNRGSSSARLVQMAREGRLRLMWHQETREETRIQLRKIPPISWAPFADLFVEENEVTGDLGVADYGFVEDWDDRKFAALAEKTEALLVTNDRHLLDVAGRLAVGVVTTGEALRILLESKKTD